ncbi:MAG: hypothetical protein AABY78_04685 [Nitrospirota bacterium]|mgnify:FL=1|jgi:hypothetical protein
MTKDIEKVILHYFDEKIIRGYIKSINPESETISIKTKGKDKRVKLSDLKAIFFVKAFVGNRSYREKKVYGLTRSKGRKVLVKFKDGEFLTGFLEGPLPWRKGFFLDSPDPSLKGFFLLPTDRRSNNIKIFIVNSSVKEVIVP